MPRIILKFRFYQNIKLENTKIFSKLSFFLSIKTLRNYQIFFWNKKWVNVFGKIKFLFNLAINEFYSWKMI